MAEGDEIRFLPFAGRRIAYTITGDGPPVIASAWWVSHLELDGRDPRIQQFWDSACAGRSVVRYDRPGVGMSDRDVGDEDLTPEAEVAVLGAVIDELGLERVTLLGGSSGSCVAVAFAARFPERVDRLVLYGSYAYGAEIAPPEVRDAILAAVRSHWGLGSRLLATVFLGDADSAAQEQFVRLQRAATSAHTAAALLELVYQTDVRAELRQIRVPTVVLHRREDRAIRFALGREVAAEIPGARFVALDGSAHFPWLGDAAPVARAVRSALAGGSASAGTNDAQEPEGALLSEREREVLRLVADGLSDQRIAEQLVVSPHTVHRHVANIRNKLSCGTRTAAVAEAARLGLL